MLVVCSFASAEFRLQGAEVTVRLNDDATASVVEKINLIVVGQYSMQMYESGFSKNTLVDWQRLTDISEIKKHISETNSSIPGITIRPQPLEKSKSMSEVWYGQLILEYEVHPFYDAGGRPVNGTGLVNMEKYKPRTTRYNINENALSFPRTARGDIKLDEGVTLALLLPQGALVSDVNPRPDELEGASLPAQARKVSWSGITLAQFSLAYELEQGLDKEVVEFFSELQQAIRTSLVSGEGLAALLIAAILVLSYFYLRLSRR